MAKQGSDKAQATPELDVEKLAEVAFNAYGDRASWRTWDDKRMPYWSEVGNEVQERWVAAVAAVIDQVVGKQS